MPKSKKLFPKKTGLQSPRITFNWGYHDAANDVRTQHARTAPLRGEWYANGYHAGLAEAQAGRSTENSSPAWRVYFDSLPIANQEAIKREQWECEVGELENCLNRPADAYIRESADKYTQSAIYER